MKKLFFCLIFSIFSVAGASAFEIICNWTIPTEGAILGESAPWTALIGVEDNDVDFWIIDDETEEALLHYELSNMFNYNDDDIIVLEDFKTIGAEFEISNPEPDEPTLMLIGFSTDSPDVSSGYISFQQCVNCPKIVILDIVTTDKNTIPNLEKLAYIWKNHGKGKTLESYFKPPRAKDPS